MVITVAINPVSDSVRSVHQQVVHHL